MTVQTETTTTTDIYSAPFIKELIRSIQDNKIHILKKNAFFVIIRYHLVTTHFLWKNRLLHRM